MAINRSILLVYIVFLVGCHSAPVERKILASNSWTGAYLEAAGVTAYEVLAPISMPHPAEYELQLSDFKRIKGASAIVYAGYEVMVEKMVMGIDTGETRLIKISTGFNFQEISASVLMLAGIFNTDSVARKNLILIDSTLAVTKREVVKKGWAESPVLVHFHQQKLAHELGLNVVGVFGPHPPEAYELISLLSAHPKLIIDNYHNPVGKSLQEAGSLQRVEWINFPGPHSTHTISDVIATNVQLLPDSGI